MTKKYIRIAELIYKDKIGNLTEQEKCELLAWLEESDFNRQIFDELAKGSSLSRSYDEYRNIHREQVWNAIEKQIVPQGRQLSLQWVGYAASVMILVVAGWFIFQMSDNKNVVQEGKKVARITPGTQKAILYLDNGEQVVLADNNTVVVEDSLSGRIEQVDKSLVYQTESTVKEERLNVLEIPNGGEFQVTLADGTKVCLNAGTKLTYPIAFVGKERRVHLEGEGYFEVKRDENKPFIVEIKGMEVKVLGTSFNLRSFAADNRSTATLISGKIEVKTSLRRVELSPNQQADLLVGENKLDVREVDAAVYSAWTKGRFVFRRERLETILDDVSRWYNVTVFYEQSSAKDILFSGIMERYADISKTLEMLEKTGKVSFIIDEQKIIVRAK
ncbi:FecR family protein [Butyricimonas virosa]|uniref:FecR family protein n=1 Tax=Butyricimonas virosa TaxID=544645 RepID=UPI00241F7EB3|nr:FecR domain-containing protein [Butyricimonas virosa]MCI6415680.1 DUF4974 domain-containing protein [Butyricimonas virosa]